GRHSGVGRIRMPKASSPRKTATSPPVASTPPQPLTDASEPSEQDIRLRAYQRYLERGQQPGTDFDDWIAAERDLHSERRSYSPGDPDAYKGAVEGDRPGDRQQGNRRAPGVDSSGMPSDPIATAQDSTGARADGTQG